ncbi:MAG: hypothetical protein Q4G13_06770 [Moraxella sp.]|nr:hypothetical protein [Moraxella sp.]
MLWELVGAISAGLGLMGIVLLVRLIFKKIPKYSLPIACGLGMLMFSMYQEYSWFEHTKARLPAGVVVVASASPPVFYKPWTYWQAPVSYFVAVDGASSQSTDTPSIRQTRLYFFQRLMSAHEMAILVDCEQKLQSDFVKGATPNWGKTPMTDGIVGAVCE